MALLPKPTILPPLVLVVWNQASTENSLGPTSATELDDVPLLPLKAVDDEV